MAASRVLVGLSSAALAEVDDAVTLPQFRVLAVLARHGSCRLSGLADVLGVHPSSATRICDRLVAGGLLERAEDPADRRSVVLTLSPAGRRLVDAVMHRRRTAVERVLHRMPPDQRRALVAPLRALAAAGGEDEAAPGWALH